MLISSSNEITLLTTRKLRSKYSFIDVEGAKHNQIGCWREKDVIYKVVGVLLGVRLFGGNYVTVTLSG